jgi:predicted small metal-binding protein
MADLKRSDISEPGRGLSGNKDDYSFRCSDAGFTECQWQTRASSEDEILRRAEQHGREQHNLTNIDDKTRNLVRSKIRHAA